PSVGPSLPRRCRINLDTLAFRLGVPSTLCLLGLPLPLLFLSLPCRCGLRLHTLAFHLGLPSTLRLLSLPLPLLFLSLPPPCRLPPHPLPFPPGLPPTLRLPTLPLPPLFLSLPCRCRLRRHTLAFRLGLPSTLCLLGSPLPLLFPNRVRTLYLPPEHIHVVVEIAAGAHSERLAVDQLSQRLWQVSLRRDIGAADEERNDRDVTPECRLELDANPVGRQVEPSTPIRVACVNPAIVDHGEDDIAPRDCLLEVLTEVAPRRDRIHVHEHVLVAETLG